MLRRLCQTSFAVAVLAIAALAFPAAASACPGCKEATSEQSVQMARGYSYSILFMMPIPFIILGSFGGYVYYTVRKRDEEATSPTSTATPVHGASTQESDASRSQ